MLDKDLQNRLTWGVPLHMKIIPYLIANMYYREGM